MPDAQMTRLVTFRKRGKVKTIQSFPGWETYDLKPGAEYYFNMRERTPWVVVTNEPSATDDADYMEVK